MEKSSTIRVKHKGQITIPSEIRRELGLEEGMRLEIHRARDGILLKARPSIEPGRVVGKDEYQKIIRELDESRREWR